jgi:toxin ParE1/3/4
MYEIKRSPLLRDDLIEIWLYIAQDNPAAADRVLDKLEQKFSILAANPRIGRLRSDIGPDVRSFAVGNYIVLYRERTGGIEIGRVIHGKRDLSQVQVP